MKGMDWYLIWVIHPAFVWRVWCKLWKTLEYLLSTPQDIPNNEGRVLTTSLQCSVLLTGLLQLGHMSVTSCVLKTIFYHSRPVLPNVYFGGGWVECSRSHWSLKESWCVFIPVKYSFVILMSEKQEVKSEALKHGITEMNFFFEVGFCCALFGLWTIISVMPVGCPL